jgi:peroxiredoxin
LKHLCMVRLVAIFSFLWTLSIPGLCEAKTPVEGDSLAGMIVQGADLERDRTYLGIHKEGPFALGDIEAELILLEIAGVYCPVCHNQAPRLNQLFARIQKNKQLSSSVKFMVLATGTPMEIEHLRVKFNSPFPILNDPGFVLHKSMGEPKTPYTMLVRKDGKVTYAHLGAIEDMDAFLQRIRDLLQ